MVKMKSGESLKSYVTYFQSQMALVYNYNEDVAITTFISTLQVTHSFYKHLIKNEVTKMWDVLTRAQKYIQIENVTRVFVNRSPSEEENKRNRKCSPIPP